MAFCDPSRALAQFKLEHGSKVADLGTGSGFYSLAAAHMVGGQGKVWAVEVQKDLASKLRNEATHRHIENLEVVWGDIERIGGTKLKEGSADAAIVANVLFQAEDKPGLVAETSRILRKGGRVLLIDWSDEEGARAGGLGPVSHHLVSKGAALSLFEKGGFTLQGTIDAGDHHYGLILKKP